MHTPRVALAPLRQSFPRPPASPLTRLRSSPPTLTARALSPLGARALGTSSPTQAVKDFASAFLHGSEELKEEARAQHSKLVGRNKYVHEFQKHKILPQHVEQYKQLIAGYYKGIHESPEFDARLTGSFEVVVGEVDTIVHIFEYQGFEGFERQKQAIRESKGHLQFFNKEILPLIQSRTSQLNSEFKFLPAMGPQERGGVYELRTYDLKPGSLLEWEESWRVGLEARIKAGHSPAGAWFSQVGQLHQVHMMWHYDSLEQRRDRRSRSWEHQQWASTVARTTKLCNAMHTNILKPLPFSPLR